MTKVCEKCRTQYDDAYRSTICPHDMFSANDGQNNFTMGPDAANRDVKDWEATVEIERDEEGRFILVQAVARCEEGHPMIERANEIAKLMFERFRKVT